MSDLLIDIQNVRKTYRGKVEALKGISLSVPKGSVFGLLGPNGAGKSTLVKVLTSIIRPSSCEGQMLGAPVGHKPTLRKVGYLPEHASFPEYLTGRQVVEYSAGLSGLGGGDITKRCDELLETVGMREAAKRKIKTYSKGMKQRVGIAQALINDPDLIFLDEPTDGVDPEGRRDLLDLVLRMREKGCTIFINTHLLSELERVADRIAILLKGEVARVGSLEELTASKTEYTVLVGAELKEGIQDKVIEMGAVVNGAEIVLEDRDLQQLQELIDLLRRNEVMIESIQPKRLSLEEFFLETIHESRNEPVTR